MRNPVRNKVLSFAVRAIVCFILLAVGLSIFGALVRTKPQPARTDASERAPQVFVYAARPVPVGRQWDGYGTVQAIDSADVPARVTATVIEIEPGVRAGTEVTAGMVLVQLDDSDFQRQAEIAEQTISDIDAQLQRIAIEQRSWTERAEIAREQVELAQAEFDRVRRAQERDVAMPREVDAAKASLLAAIRDETAVREEMEKVVPRRLGLQAQRAGQVSQQRLARQNVERCRITSPIDGVLQDVFVEVGENLMGGERVARVVNVELVEVALRLPAAARATVRRGDGVALRASNRERTWSAPIARIAPEDDTVTRTMPVYVEIEQAVDTPGALAPGQFLRASVSSSQVTPRWVVPRRAVGQERVILIVDGLTSSRSIDIDFQLEGRLPESKLPDEQWVVLRDPLPEGALVVLNASRAYPDGMRVDPVVAGADSVADRGPDAGNEAAP